MADNTIPAPLPGPDVIDDGFVVAVSRSTGAKQRVPRKWLTLSDAGVPGFDFTLPPSTKPSLTKPAKESTDA
jgi:hypothetical protein